MRLGYSIGATGLTPAAVTQLAQLAERCGYDSVWSSEVVGADPIPVLGLIAAQTSSIGVGTAVLQMSGRSAVTTATTAVTLARMSAGRFRLGIGPSGPQVVEGWHGQPYRRPLALARDYVEVLRLALAGKPIAYQGPTLTLPLPGGQGTAMRLPSVQPRSSGVPIYLAGLGPEAVALAGELADGWLAIHCPPQYIAQASTWLARGASRVGRSLRGDFDAAVMVLVHIDDDADLARQMVRPGLAVYLGGMGTASTNFYNRLAARLGFSAEAAAVQRAFLDGELDEAMLAMSDELVDAMTVCGPPEVVRRRLAAYRDAGTGTLIAGSMAPSAAMRGEQLQALAELAAGL